MPKKKVLSSKPKVLTNKQNLWSLFIFFVFAGLLYFSKDFLFAATVNGAPVYRSTFNNAVIKQSGRQILDGLIAEKLILQDGEKKKIKITDKEIDAQMGIIEKNLGSRGQKLDQALAQQGLTRGQLREQIRIQKILEKLLDKDIVVTEREIDEFIKANGQFITSSTNQTSLKNNVRQQLVQSKLQEKAQGLIDKLKKEAKIDYFVSF